MLKTIDKVCPFEAIARKTKINSLERFRDQIVTARKNIICDYPEFNKIRGQANKLLQNIDNELTRLKK